MQTEEATIKLKATLKSGLDKNSEKKDTQAAANAARNTRNRRNFKSVPSV